MLGIRVKDTVFKFWDRLRKEGVSLQSNGGHISILDLAEGGGAFSPTFNGGGAHSLMIHDHSSCSLSSIHNNSSFLEESSVTSALYLRAKAIYKMRKLFNHYKLKPHFDTFVIKSYHQNFRKDLFNLEGRRLV